MSEQSSRFIRGGRRAGAVAAALSIAALGAGIAGCGSDSNSNDASNAVKSAGSQAQSVENQIQQAPQSQNGGSSNYGY